MKRVSVIFGTRPEAIKLGPVIEALRSHRGIVTRVCVTAQHREMLDQALRVFGITPDVDLRLMQPGQSLPELTARALTSLDAYLAADAPDLVLVQGDTTTTFCAALAAFYHRIPVGHVEAGLRTYDRGAPFPEEMNRVLTTHLGHWHFAPTERTRRNLLAEGIPPERIAVTGNTVVDALRHALGIVRAAPPEIPGLPSLGQERLVLITGHRRESFGAGFESICRAIGELARRYPDVAFVYPVHLNPNVREPVHRVLHGLPNVHLLEPLDYLPFVALMDRATLILSDSGGIQEEAPTLGTPVLVMRDTTERSEAIDAGVARLVGTDARVIVDAAATLLDADRGGARAAVHANPFGDGHAARRIVEICARVIGASTSEVPCSSPTR